MQTTKELILRMCVLSDVYIRSRVLPYKYHHFYSPATLTCTAVRELKELARSKVTTFIVDTATEKMYTDFEMVNHIN
jgi:hypothetical protein